MVRSPVLLVTRQTGSEAEATHTPGTLLFSSRTTRAWRMLLIICATMAADWGAVGVPAGMAWLNAPAYRPPQR